jgi:hypothetical protein
MSFQRGTIYNFQDDTGVLIPLIFDYSVVAYPKYERIVYYYFYENKNKEYKIPKMNKNKKYVVQDDKGMYKFMFFQEKIINKNNVSMFLFINNPSLPIHPPHLTIDNFYRIPSVIPTYGSSKTGLDPTRTVRQNIGGKRRRTRRTRSHRPRR